MTKTVTLSFEDYEMKALESEFVDVSEFFQNFVNHRYQLREKIIDNGFNFVNRYYDYYRHFDKFEKIINTY